MTSDFNFDQRLQRTKEVLQNYGQVTIFNRGGSSSESEVKTIDVKTTFKKGILFYLEYNFRILFHLLKNKYQIVYSADMDTMIGVGMASYFKKFLCIYDSHEIFSEVPELEGKTTKKFIWLQFENIFVKRADICLTVNESLARIFESQHNKTFHVIRNVPFKINALSKKNNRGQIILYQGAINEGRGIEQAIKAMKYLPEYKLYIYGGGDKVNTMEELIINEGLSNNVEMKGKVVPKLLTEVTQGALIGLNLLEVKSKNYYFSMANKFYDYIQAGIPSLNMDFPEYTYALSKYHVGECINSLDPKLIADKIKQMASKIEEGLYESEIAKAKEVYNWENERELFIKILEEKI